MAKADDLKKFLKEQQAKRDAREQARRDDVAKLAIQRRNAKRTLLIQFAALIPDEVKEYAKLNTDFEPFMIVLSIPGCYPIWVTIEDTGAIVATVYPPLNPALPVQAVPALPFPIRGIDDLSDAIAADVVEP